MGAIVNLVTSDVLRKSFGQLLPLSSPKLLSQACSGLKCQQLGPLKPAKRPALHLRAETCLFNTHRVADGQHPLGGLAEVRAMRSTKRRLEWGQTALSQDSEDYKASEAAPDSPCCPAVGSAAGAGGISFSTPTELVQALRVDGDRAAVKSPIIAALFLEGRHKARVLAQAQQPDEAPAAGAGGAEQQPSEGAAQQHRSSQDQLPPKDAAEENVQQQCQRVLAAAGSSSRGCLDLLCWGVALDVQQRAAASPATPPAAGLDLLPAPPRKRSAAFQALPAGRVVRPCRAARMLPGLAPTSQGELEAVRAWMALQNAQ